MLVVSFVTYVSKAIQPLALHMYPRHAQCRSRSSGDAMNREVPSMKVCSLVLSVSTSLLDYTSDLVGMHIRLFIVQKVDVLHHIL